MSSSPGVPLDMEDAIRLAKVRKERREEFNARHPGLIENYNEEEWARIKEEDCKNDTI